jgi:hypothetical protein
MTRPNLVALLAYLDFIVREPKQTSLDAEASEAYISKILTELAAKFEDRYTTEVIKAQLCEEFSKVETHAKYNLKLLFLHGSRELRLDPATQRDVQEHLTQIILQESGRTRQTRRRPVNSLIKQESRPQKPRKPVSAAAARKSGTLDNIVVANPVICSDKVIKARCFVLRA